MREARVMCFSLEHKNLFNFYVDSDIKFRSNLWKTNDKLIAYVF